MLGAGISVGSVLWFIRWICEFIARRSDIRSANLDVRQQAIEERYDARLAHLELDLARTRRAATMLLNWVGREHPSSPVLERAAELLAPYDSNISGPVTDVPPRSAELEEFIKRAKRTGEEF
jgi:hypothetical protein